MKKSFDNDNKELMEEVSYEIEDTDFYGDIEEPDKDYSWKEVKVVGGPLNLRRNPRSDADIIKVLEEGTELFTDTKSGEWLHVLLPEDVMEKYEGYVMAKFVEAVED